MAPSESSAAPSYPARVVRYLSERRHALECGSLEREAYDAEVERVFERVLEDTNRGCATKILTVNALREANLCDEKTAARYKTLCVGSKRGGAFFDDAIPFDDDVSPGISPGTTDESRGVRLDDGAARMRRETKPKETRAARISFENTLWHSEPGRDPWAFAYDEDTHVMRELEYLTEKSRAMNERARRVAEAQAGELANARAAAEAAETRGRRVELFGKNEKRPEDETKKTYFKSDADRNAAEGERLSGEVVESDATRKEKDKGKEKETERAEDAARRRAVLASTATSARVAEAAARDVTRFAEALEKKYPFPRNANAALTDLSTTNVSPIERGVIASWDDVDPRRPLEASVPVVVHWTDVGAREEKKQAKPPAAARGENAAADEAAADEAAADEPKKNEAEAVVTVTAPVVSSSSSLTTASRANENETKTLIEALVRDAIARVVRDEKAKEEASGGPGGSGGVVASAASPPASPHASRVPTVKALLVGCAYFAPRRPEMTRLRGALNDVAAIREVLASGYGLDADDPEKTRVLIDRPAKEKKTSSEPSKPATKTSSFFGAFSGRKTSALRNDDESDDWKTGLAVPPQLRNTDRFVDDDDEDDQITDGNADRSAPTAANVRAGLRWLTRDAKPGDVLFFHFSGHATQVPSLVSETGELDGADEALCCVDTDWETPSTCITERDLLESFFADAPRGATCVASVDAKFCGALRGSATYAADDAFVEASRRRLESHSVFSEKRARAHDELFGRFVPPPKTVAAEIARRASAARAAPLETKRATATAAAARRKEVRLRLGNGSGALLGCDAAKGETCRETLCADGAVRGAFSEALCAALNKSARDEVSFADGGVDADAETFLRKKTTRSLVDEHTPLASLAAAAAAAARDRLETAFAVGEYGARAQTPIAVEASEGGERDEGGGSEGMREGATTRRG
jgi:hypothetical protein